MPSVELRREGDLAYRERVPEGPEAGPPVVLLHGYPESSRMWVPLMEALAGAGRRSIAPDLYGLGDSADDRPATFERNVEAFTDLHRGLGLGRGCSSSTTGAGSSGSRGRAITRTRSRRW